MPFYHNSFISDLETQYVCVCVCLFMYLEYLSCIYLIVKAKGWACQGHTKLLSCARTKLEAGRKAKEEDNE